MPGALAGEVGAVASKSMAHRLLILAALAPATCDIDCNASSADIEATARCLEALGAHVARTKVGFRVVPVPRGADGRPVARQDALLDCGESGSTLRFLLPVACALAADARLTGHGRLAERPLSPLYEQLVDHGAVLSLPGRFPLAAQGRLRGGRFVLPGNVSSQYVSGLLLAAPLLAAPVEVLVSEPVESAPYIGLTVGALATFGIGVTREPRTLHGTSYQAFRVEGTSQLQTPASLVVEGDWSNAAFWLAAGAIGLGPVGVSGLQLSSTQGDRAMLGALARFGARFSLGAHAVRVTGARLKGQEMDVSAFPDLVPPLAAVAACAEGTTRLTGAGRLRLKESDRLQTVSAALRAMGVDAHDEKDALVIRGAGQDTIEGGTVDAANDHRIAMMAAVLATRAAGPTTILGADCVAKSYPTFFDDFAQLGGSLANVQREA